MANIQWNQINPNFSSTASLADAATRSISQAGTIFGEMRKQILEEEQRTIDNAYREKTFNENARQFGLQYALDQDRLKETIRANQAAEDNTRRGQDLSHKAAMANVAAERSRIALLEQQYKDEQQQRADAIAAQNFVLQASGSNLVKNSDDNKKEITRLQNIINSGNATNAQKLELQDRIRDQSTYNKIINSQTLASPTAMQDAIKSAAGTIFNTDSTKLASSGIMSLAVNREAKKIEDQTAIDIAERDKAIKQKNWRDNPSIWVAEAFSQFKGSQQQQVVNLVSYLVDKGVSNNDITKIVNSIKLPKTPEERSLFEGIVTSITGSGLTFPDTTTSIPTINNSSINTNNTNTGNINTNNTNAFDRVFNKTEIPTNFNSLSKSEQSSISNAARIYSMTEEARSKYDNSKEAYDKRLEELTNNRIKELREEGNKKANLNKENVHSLLKGIHPRDLQSLGFDINNLPDSLTERELSIISQVYPEAVIKAKRNNLFGEYSKNLGY